MFIVGCYAVVSWIETMGSVMTKLIERNTTIPTESQAFSTAADNQPSVKFMFAR